MSAQRRLNGGEVVERYVDELARRPLRQEERRRPFVAGGEGETGMAVVALLNGDDGAPLGRMARRLDRDLDRLAAARREHRVLQIARRGAHQRRGELGAGAARKMMVADVERGERIGERGDHFRVAVAEVEHAAVEMEVEQLATVEIPDAVALAAADHQVHAQRLQHLHAVRTDVPRREIEDPLLLLGHRPSLFRAPAPVPSRKPPRAAAL